jgi:hypothetical protein
LRSDIYESHGPYAGQGSRLVFPTEGCWEITAKVDDSGAAGLTFVTLVVKTSAGQPVSECPVTIPSSGGASPAFNYGNGVLGVGLPEDGIIRAKPGDSLPAVLADGSIAQKFPWQRAVWGGLFIVGKRLDASAPPVRPDLTGNYGSSGFQASTLIFPTEGCWEVTAFVGEREKPSGPPLTFVVQVVKVGQVGDVPLTTTAISASQTVTLSPTSTPISTASTASIPSVIQQTAKPTITTESQAAASGSDRPTAGGRDESSSIVVIIMVLVALGMLLGISVVLLLRRIGRDFSGSSGARQ